MNINASKVKKIEDLAHRWWDPNSEFKPLHDIMPILQQIISGQSAS